MFLENKTCYLCGGMHQATDNGTNWRNYVETILQKDFKVNSLNPAKIVSSQNVSEIGDDKKRFKQIILEENWELLKKEFWPIVHKDLRCVDKSDFLICYYDSTSHLVGTIHELVIASLQKKPILLKYNPEHLSSFNPWISIFIKKDNFFNNWKSLFDYLHKVNNGQYNSSHWE
jgi:hypothetical protein